MKKAIYPGEIFGSLVAIKKIPGSRERPTKWICKCECGTQNSYLSSSLRSKNTGSCGCRGSRATIGERSKTHGMSKQHVYGIWAGMHNRCYNKKVRGYHNYGGRGIYVCARWRKFENFLADMGIPEKGLSIERINNDKMYSPSNCKWATKREQMYNTTRSVKLTHDGLTLNLGEWSKKLGVTRGALYQRMRNNLPEDRLFAARSLVNQYSK